MISFLLLSYLSSTVAIATWDSCPPEANAVYREDSKSILLCEDDPALQEDALVHELGHHLYFHYLTERQRTQWDRSHEACDKDECFIAEPAETNATEDFAVTFEAIHTGLTCDGRVCRAKTKFVKRIIQNLLEDI